MFSGGGCTHEQIFLLQKAKAGMTSFGRRLLGKEKLPNTRANKTCQEELSTVRGFGVIPDGRVLT
jgi:hypothetical protein